MGAQIFNLHRAEIELVPALPTGYIFCIYKHCWHIQYVQYISTIDTVYLLQLHACMSLMCQIAICDSFASIIFIATNFGLKFKLELLKTYPKAICYLIL